MQNNEIPIYSLNNFEGMRKAGSLAARILDELKEKIAPGVSTL
jgi:methionine aminopeptidase